MPSIRTRFMTVRAEDVSAVGRSDVGDLYVVFRSGATHHVKYNNPEECNADCEKISDAVDDDYGPTCPEPED